MSRTKLDERWIEREIFASFHENVASPDPDKLHYDWHLAIQALSRNGFVDF